MPSHPLGLRENPFGAGHDPRLTYPSQGRVECLTLLRQALESGEPFILLTGATGTGKTSVVSEAFPGGSAVAVNAHPSFTCPELIEHVCLSFGVGLPNAPSKPQALARLEEHLTGLRSGGESPVLIVDEAHGLGLDLLEEIRLLSNLETEGRPLLQIVLAGLPGLEEKLARPELAPLRQRIAVHVRLGPLSSEETARYIHHRVSAAGANGPEMFPPNTCLEIHRLARGVPREINRVASQAMLQAGRDAASAVTPAHVRAAAADAAIGGVAGEGHAVPAASPPSRERLSPSPGKPTPRDPEVGEWVSRFVGSEGPVRIGSRAGSPQGSFATPEETEPASEPERSDATRGERPRTPLVSRTRGRPRRRASRSSEASRLTLAAVAVALVAVAVILVTRGRKLAPAPYGAAVTTTADRLAGEPSSSPPPATLPDRPPSPAVTARKPAPAAIGGPGAPTPTAVAAPASPTLVLGLAVGTCLDLDRAHAECARLLESTGFRCQTLTTTEGGAVVYRVVLGSFKSRPAAERAADELLRRSLVSEARIVVLASGDPPSN